MMQNSVSRLMSQSLEKFDKNPTARVNMSQGQSNWGLPPGAQLYRAAKLAIDHGQAHQDVSKAPAKNTR